MQTKIIDGTRLSAEIQQNYKQQIEAAGKQPSLCILIAGNDPASHIYVNNKTKAAKKIGVQVSVIYMQEHTTEERVIETITALNNSSSFDGILVQLPLPQHISTKNVIRAISPSKDVDGFHPINIGSLAAGDPTFVPCTPAGITKMLEHEGIDVCGKHAVLIGASNIVGKPMAHLLLQREATITICHIKTPDISVHTKQADVVITAVGKPNLITGDMIKPGAVVIDVGITRINGKVVGDVDQQSVNGVASFLTPVPGGVGPMTIAMLLANTYKAMIGKQ